MTSAAPAPAPAPVGAGVPPRSGLHLMVVDSDAAAATELAAALGDHDVHLEVFDSAAVALLAAGRQSPDAALVAARLAPISSTEVVRALRQSSGIPVVVGIGDGDGDVAAAALAAGATACVARPYRPAELVPILRAIRLDSAGTPEPAIQRGALRLDPATQEVSVDGVPVPMPPREFQLLHFFLARTDRVVSRTEIRAAIWPDTGPDSSNTIAVHIRRLRARLGDSRDNPRIIVTVRGRGYRLIPPPPLR